MFKFRPVDKNPLFKFDEDESFVVKGLSPIQAQRAKDGTPMTFHAPTAIKPPDKKLTLDSLKKSATMPEAKPVDPDAVVKAFLES